MTRLRQIFREKRATVAVEFALISTLFLMPLLAGAADFVIIIAARAQLNTSLQALYAFATSAPASAASSTIAGYIISTINAANGASVITISMPATSTTPLKLGNITLPVGTTMPVSYYGCYSSASSITYQTTACSSGQTQQIYVLYELTGQVTLPLYLPGLGSSYTVAVGGGIQTQ